MKNLLLLFIVTIFLCAPMQAQEYADFAITTTNEGTGTFNSAMLPNFTWVATGSINGSAEIRADELFHDGNALENTFGQADAEESLSIQIIANGEGTIGSPIVSKSRLTISFNQTTPAEGWGFCVRDIDVENCLISAIDANDNAVSVEKIDDWLIELFDADTIVADIKIPKWDPTYAALLGSGTPDDYTVYNNIVIGGLPADEAACALFMPDLPLKKLFIDFENLQDINRVSYRFYIASLAPNSIKDNNENLLKIYPNPATSALNMRFAGSYGHGAAVELFTLSGINVLKSTIPAGLDTFKLELGSLPSGVYFLRVCFDERKPFVRKIIKR